MPTCAVCETDLREAPVVSEMARFGRPSRRVACWACGLVQVSPQPSADDLMEFYRSHAYREEHGKVALCYRDGTGNTLRIVRPDEPEYPEAFAAMGRFRCLAGLEVAGNPEPGRVLDVGCGPGHVLDEYLAQGWKTYGCEPDEDEAEIAICAGHSMSIGDMGDLVAGRKYDLIVAHHVLEHLLDPVASLRRMRSMLAPGGKVVIEVPNILEPNGDLDANHFQWVHLFDFDRSTLANAFRRAGLTYQFREAGTVVWAVGEPAEEGTTTPERSGWYMHGYLDAYRKWGRR